MLKKILTIALAAVMLFSVALSANAADPIKVTVDGKAISLDVAPVIESGRTLAPIRAIAEALGAEVQYNETTKTVTVTSVGTNIKLAIGSTSATVNNATKTLDVAAKIIDGRTLLPVRFISEALGAKVDYVDASRTAVVKYFSDMNGTLKIGGSTTVQPIEQAAADKLIAMNSGLSVAVAGGGSGVGLTGVNDGTLNLGGYSKDLSDADLKTYPSTVATHIGNDGIAIILHPSNPVSNLTKQQVFDIFTGKITNWKDVGGENAPIFVQQRESTSGTRVAFKELALDIIDKNKKTDVIETATPHASSGLILQAVAQNKNAIGYESFGYLNNTVKAVSIEGISATTANAVSKKFPYVRPLNLLTKGTPSGLSAKFVNYLLSPEGQKLIASDGYIALKIND